MFKTDVQVQIDVDGLKAKWDGMNAEMRERLPEKDAKGKRVKPEEHELEVAKLEKLVRAAVDSVVLDAVAEQLRASIMQSVLSTPQQTSS